MKTKLDLNSPEDRIILAECMVQPLLRHMNYASLFCKIMNDFALASIEKEELLLYNYLFFYQKEKIEKNKRKIKNSIMELEA